MSNHTMTACDRCNLVRSNEWWKAEGQRILRFCADHTAKHGPALTAQGWIEIPELDEQPVTVLTGGDPARECG